MGYRARATFLFTHKTSLPKGTKQRLEHSLQKALTEFKLTSVIFRTAISKRNGGSPGEMYHRTSACSGLAGERPFFRSCVGEPLKRGVRLLSALEGSHRLEGDLHASSCAIRQFLTPRFR